MTKRANITAAEFNALPGNVRRYIMYLETDCDPSGTIRSELYLREEIVPALEMWIKELQSDQANPHRQQRINTARNP